MWKNSYKDYQPDEPWIQQSVEPGNGIVGCEMHELNGWGEVQHTNPPKKKGLIRSFLDLLFGPKEKSKDAI